MLTDRWFRTESFRAQPETSSSPESSTGSEERAIRAVMASYNNALNNGSTDAALALYAEDGVFMPPYSQSAIGKEAVRKAYDKVFQELKFDVRFTIAELVVMASSWAFVRTNSAGMTGHASTGKTTAEANQELFIFRKDGDGKWRIARYGIVTSGVFTAHYLPYGWTRIQ